MRIHTSATRADLRAASERARATLVTCSEHVSRSRDRGFEVKLEGSSRRRPNWGTSGGSGDGYAATWDQWGVFLGHLFDVDSSAKCWAYDGAGAFHYATFDRFVDGWPSDAHGDHTFRYQGVSCVQSCTKCSASQTREARMKSNAP